MLEVTGSKGTSSVSRCCISKQFHVDQVTIYKNDYELVLGCYKCATVFVPQITSHISFVLWQFEFTKAPLPDSKEDKIDFSKKLLKYNITLAQYESTLAQREIKP